MKKHYTKNFLGNRLMQLAMAATLVLGAGSTSVAQTYCTPTYTYNCSSGDDIKDFKLTGANGTMISNLNNPCPSTGYFDYTASTVANMTCSLIQNGTYTGNVTTNYMYGNEDVRAWIDYNNNGLFEASEQLFAPLINLSSTSLGAYSLTVPLAAPPGVRRMRVRLVYGGGVGIDPCASAYYGECHDYNVTILPLAPPNNAGIGSLVNPAPNEAFCSNSFKDVTVSVVNLGNNALNTANVYWSLDGVMQPSTTLPVALPNYKDSVSIVLGTVLFPTTAPRVIKAWTALPNGVADTDHTDDTLNSSPAAIMQGVDVHVTPNDTTICIGNTIVLDAGEHPLNPFYIWENGSLDRTHTVSADGVYTVKVQNNIGCFDIDTVIVTVHPEPLINSIAIIDNGDMSFTFNAIGVQNISSYTWDFDDASNNVDQPGSPTQLIHEFAVCGEYNVTLTVRNDCGEITATRLVKIDCNTTGIDNLSALQKEISVFPNPSVSKVTIANKAHIKMKEVSIVNLMGQSVYKNEKVNAEQLELNISAFSAGIYNVMINTEKGMVTKKLEVIK
jgi:hypothetical protein